MKRCIYLLYLIIFLVFFCTSIAAASPNLILEYEMTIENPSSHMIKVQAQITNNQSRDIPLARGVKSYAPAAPISNLKILDNQGNSIPYQFTEDDMFQEMLLIPGSFKSIIVSYEANLLNTDTNISTPYYLSEKYGTVEWPSLIYSTQHSIEDLCTEYGTKRTQYYFKFNLPDGWREFCPLEKESGRYKFALPYQTIMASGIMGPLAFFPSYTEYVREIGGVETRVVFSEGYLPEAAEQYANDLLDFYSWANDNVGSIACNNRFPTKKYLICFFPIIDGVYPKNLTHNILGFSRAEHYNKLSDANWSDPQSYRRLVAGACGSFIMEGFVSANDAAILNVHSFHEGLIKYIGFNGVEELKKWSNAEKNACMIDEEYNPYLSIAGTAADKPVYDPNYELRPIPHNSDYIVVYNKTTMVWFILDKLIQEKSEGKHNVQSLFKYLFAYFTLTEGGSGLDSDHILNTINGLTAHDFTDIFNRYVYGNDLLPLYTENGVLKIDRNQLPQIPSFPPPIPPSGLSFKVTGDVDCLSWNPVDGVLGYNLYRSFGGHFWGDKFIFAKVNDTLLTQTSLSINRADQDLAVDTHVFYVITSVGKNGAESLYSNLATDWEYIGSLTAPTLALNVEETTANLSWNKVPGADGYTLYYAPAPYTGPHSINSLEMGNQMQGYYNLWNGVSFYLAVKAHNNCCSSGYSNIEFLNIP